jgi:hypothetical protein
LKLPHYGSLLRFFDVVFLPEPFYAARRIDELLLAGKERMTRGTNFHLDVFYGGTGLDNVPAGAGYRRLFIFRMNLVSHTNPLAAPLSAAAKTYMLGLFKTAVIKRPCSRKPP